MAHYVGVNSVPQTHLHLEPQNVTCLEIVFADLTSEDEVILDEGGPYPND